MEINTIVDGNAATVKLAGRLTVQTAPELESAIDAIPEEVADIAIDLSEVDYVSSAGLRVFVATSKLAVKRGGTFSLLYPHDSVLEVLEMTGFADIFTIVR